VIFAGETQVRVRDQHPPPASRVATYYAHLSRCFVAPNYLQKNRRRQRIRGGE